MTFNSYLLLVFYSVSDSQLKLGDGKKTEPVCRAALAAK